MRLRCCAQAFSSFGEQGLLFVVVPAGFSLWWLLLLQSTGSVVVTCRLSCSMACGIFLDQGSNPCPLHWQVDSSPLRHREAPDWIILNRLFFCKTQVMAVISGNETIQEMLITLHISKVIKTLFQSSPLFIFSNVSLLKSFGSMSFSVFTGIQLQIPL